MPYIQSLTFSRRIEDPDATKGAVYLDLVRRAAEIEVDGFELAGVDAWETKANSVDAERVPDF